MAGRRIKDEIEAVAAVKAPALPNRSATAAERAVAEHDLGLAIEALRQGGDLIAFGEHVTATLARLAVLAAAG